MEKKKNNIKNENNVLKAIKNFFNNPTPLFIAFIIIIVFLLFYINQNINKDSIMVGEVDQTEISVHNIHYFLNDDINYFYADKAVYSGENKTVYKYQIGYFVENNKGELLDFATRSGSDTDKGFKLSDLINDMSGWNFMERADSPYFFKKNIMPYINKIHFVVLASTDKDSDDADINIDYEVNVINFTGK